VEEVAVALLGLTACQVGAQHCSTVRWFNNLTPSGHAPGHQSVLVRLPKMGPVLLAIDAVMMQRLFTAQRKARPKDDNQEQLRASTKKLLDVVEHEGLSLVVFGAQWKELKKAPEYYE